ncbi:cell surface protein [Corynebacterium sp. YSMAA1_1_F7]|uniref:cell surface protein n=1 Tax=Corynebacterium sp. YSMAA1_1_F7 TaxID=3383590 RepID=UPI0038CFEE65
MKLSKKITATAAATALASAALLTPVANAQTAENPPAGSDNDNNQNPPAGSDNDNNQGGANGSDNMSKEDKIAAGIGGTIVGLGVLGAVLGNAGDKAEDEAEAPKDGEKEEAPAAEAPAAEAPAKEDIEAPAAEAPAAEAPAVEAAPAEGRNVQLANTGVKPEISILAGLALISMVAGAWMMFSRRQA